MVPTRCRSMLATRNMGRTCFHTFLPRPVPPKGLTNTSSRRDGIPLTGGRSSWPSPDAPASLASDTADGAKKGCFSTVRTDTSHVKSSSSLGHMNS